MRLLAVRLLFDIIIGPLWGHDKTQNIALGHDWSRGC